MRRSVGRIAGLWLLAAALSPLLLPASSPAAEPAPATPLRQLTLKRVEFGLADGDAWGQIGKGTGWFCRHRRQPLVWNSDLVKPHPSRLTSILKDELTRVSLADPFDRTAERDRLQAAAQFRNVQAELCEEPGSGRNRRAQVDGALTALMVWQIYDPRRDAVVLQVETSVAAQAPEKASDGMARLFETAFRQGARRLADDPRLRELLTEPVAPPAAGALSPPTSLPATTSPAPPAGATPAVLSARRAVVRISTNHHQGQGALVGADGSILTARSVVGAAQFVTVRWSDGSEQVGEVLRIDIRRNLALVRSNPHGLPPLELRRGRLGAGETLFALAMPEDPKVGPAEIKPGVATAAHPLDGAAYLQTAIATGPQDAGAPLVDAKGALVGMAVAGPEPQALPSGISMFIRAGDAFDLIRAPPPGRRRRH